MEMEAVKQEHASLASQLVTLKKQIDNLIQEMDAHQHKVTKCVH